MIIDSHAHVILPVAQHLALMDAAGVEHTILFSTRTHPERASDLASFDREMNVLDAIIAGQSNASHDTIVKAMEEQAQVIRAYPTRFTGFGTVPLDLTYAETATWIQERVLAQQFRGLGEFTLAPGQMARLKPVFALAHDFGNLPLWVHTFAPLTLDDIRELITLARDYPAVPLILGHLGGLHWRTTIQLAQENPQTYLDLSAAYTVFAPTLAIQTLPERTLFSSDAPYGNPLLARTLVEQASNSATVRERVLGGTIAELLQIV